MTCAIYAKTATEQQRIGNVMRYVLILFDGSEPPRHHGRASRAG